MDVDVYANGLASEEDKTLEKKEIKVVMTCKLNCFLYEEDGSEAAGEEANIELYEENILILPDLGGAMQIPYRDISHVDISDYRIHLSLISNESIVLSEAGYYFEDLARNLTNLRNEILIQDMLMQETLIKPGIEAQYTLYNGNEAVLGKGDCEVRLYEAAVIIIPQGQDPVRVPYCLISSVQTGDYELTLVLESGEGYSLYAMGREYDPFKKCLSEAINKLAQKTQSMLKQLLPMSDPLVIRKASRFMLEGKAAKRSDIESISKTLWSEMEKRLSISGIREEYEFLNTIAQKDKICIGIKQGLMGDLTKEYLWFLIPVYSTDPQKPGNAVIMEASSGDGSGKATYVFRMVGRENYKHFSNIDALHHEADEFIKRLNYCMLAVNFRREPIYLSDEKLNDAKYVSYRTAITKLEELRELRELFIGRVIHTSGSKWSQDIMDLLEFNINAVSDSEKYSRK